jgi:hypothetical protein
MPFSKQKNESKGIRHSILRRRGRPGMQESDRTADGKGAEAIRWPERALFAFFAFCSHRMQGASCIHCH